MRAVKVIALSLIGLVIVVLVIGAFLEKDYRVERSIDIASTPEVVFEQINSLRKWEAWSPWLAKDPTIRSTYSGPESGVGATASWTSENSGAGSQAITKSEPPRRIETSLDFGEMGKATADWTFEPSGDGVQVTWGMSGTAGGPIGGYFALMMDDWVGADYEDGLSRLKALLEGQ